MKRHQRQKKGTGSTQIKAENVSKVLMDIYGVKASGVYVSPATALECSAVFACIGLLAESIAQLPVKVYQVTEGERKEDKRHDLI